ncbi:hypothetical protein H5410_029692 [Solanum commersonii]|uniref:Uncharacterized protein n=1 Tax=Solanum commersonii TaxID=4109 RepID=A0A9J5YDM7_SOLCO|nr:hypothetical protein H5410_029692 [Solanum commersonii]
MLWRLRILAAIGEIGGHRPGGTPAAGCLAALEDSAATGSCVSALDNQESNSEFLYNFWKAALMSYGSGLCIGLSIIYFMISTGNMKWLAKIIEELEHKIIMRRRKKRQSQRNYRRRENQTNYTVSALDDQESNSEFLYNFWKAALMGYGSGLCIGLSIIYFMISTGNMKWLARIIEELEHKIIMRRRKKRQSQRNYRRRENHSENKKMLA